MEILYWSAIYVLALLFPIQLPTQVPGKEVEDGPTLWAPTAHVGDQGQSPGLSLTQT